MKLKHLRPYRGAGCLLAVVDEGCAWVYLGKRRYNPGRGKWSIPGGAAERPRDGRRWESSWETARRETREETQIDPALLDRGPRDGWPHISIWFPGFRWRTYIVRLDRKPNLKPCHEFTEARWFRVDELPTTLTFGMRKALRLLRRDLDN